MKKIITVSLIIACSVIAALIIIQHTVGFDALSGKDNARIAEKAKKEVQINVKVQTLEHSYFEKTININGELTAKNSSRPVVSDSSGNISKIFFSRGDYVKRGDVVVSVDQSKPGAKYLAHNITSPVDGYIISQDLFVGQSVSSGNTLLTVGDPGCLILTLNVPEKYLANVNIGTKAYFTTAAWPDKVYNAYVSYIDTCVSTSTRTIKMELSIQDTDSRLLEGMYVHCSLVTDSVTNALVVPDSVISTYLGKSVVYTVKDSHAVRNFVETGISDDGYTVITDGLKAGDVVVVAGSVADGSLVNIVE